MSEERATPLVGGVALMERAITYLLGGLRFATPETLARPTPCREWDLRALLAHLDDALLALHEAATAGHVGLRPDEAGPADPAGVVRARAGRLLGAWAAADGPDVVSIGGVPLTTGVLAGAGAIEIATHGWDVARACGADRPIPGPLAVELLELAPLMITGPDRPGRFAPALSMSPAAPPGDRLLAYLGRDPRG